MTAEIALLNRRALAFAADSAVTISDGKNNKIYNSAEKIFELSWRSPLGLMIYNSTDFVGIPYDVLARVFRKANRRKFGSCMEACSAFLEFLTNSDRSVDNEAGHLEAILTEELKKINKEFDDGRTDALIKFIKERNGGDFGADDFRTINISLLSSIVKEHSETHRNNRLDNFLEGISEAAFSERYGEIIEQLGKRELKGWTDDSITPILKVWAYDAIRSDVFSDSLTGLVFGGFGDGDLFPSLYAIEIDGIFFNQIKCRVRHEVTIDRLKERAAIVPFAQSEMVERFLAGIDDAFESNVVNFIRRSYDKLCERVKKQLNIDLSDFGESYAGSVESLLDRMKERSRKGTLDMVDFMPKQELAYTAEAFITLTSVKRKVSAQQETVGGPIDVAVITKNEGFVWIKRKHYFDKELNSGYEVRSRVERQPGERDDSSEAPPSGTRVRKAPTKKK